MNCPNPHTPETPRPKRWFLAAAAALEVGWIVLLAVLALVR